MSTCQKCHHTHVAGDVVALSRFTGLTGLTGLTGYRAGGEVYETREDAQLALCDQRQERDA